MSLRTLNDVFFAVVERQHPRVMLEQLGDEWGAISSGALRRRVAAVAGGLRSWGIGRGDRVAILSENRPEWTIADFASLLLGAATVVAVAEHDDWGALGYAHGCRRSNIYRSSVGLGGMCG